MGVSIQMKGTNDWILYVDTLKANDELDQETRDDWVAKYDGYEMVWTFVEPTVASGDGHIDAACIYGTDYAGGGFCSGIKYVGSFSSVPQIWATWFTDALY